MALSTVIAMSHLCQIREPKVIRMERARGMLLLLQ
jgi:hypothetical protein